MWIVTLALRRPYTFVVMALLILILGIRRPSATWRPTSFPKINIPVVSIIWQYKRLPPAQFEVHHHFQRVHRLLRPSTTSRIESQTVNGAAIIKIFFQPGVDIATPWRSHRHVADHPAPHGRRATIPPLILQYDASPRADHPVACLPATKLSKPSSMTRPVSRAPGHRPGKGLAPAVALRRQAAPDHGWTSIRRR